MAIRRKLQKWMRLSSADRGLLLSAGLLLVVIRLGLLVLPFERMRRLLSSLAKKPNRKQDAETQTIEKVVWAILMASRNLPLQMSCLPQALATHILLKRRQILSELQIGVARGASGEFEAHAWVVCDGRIVIGNLPDLARFKPLSELNGKLL